MIARLPFRNDASSEVPPFGILRVTGAVELDDDSLLLLADQPNTYGSQYLHAINGPIAVAAGGYGSCYRPSEIFFARAAYDTADGTPAFGEAWGPRNATWKLKKNTGGFRILGDPDATTGTVLVAHAPMLHFKGVCDASHAKGATGTISIYTGTGDGTDTTVNMTGVWNAFADVASGATVDCRWDDSVAAGEWRLTAAEC